MLIIQVSYLKWLPILMVCLIIFLPEVHQSSAKKNKFLSHWKFFLDLQKFFFCHVLRNPFFCLVGIPPCQPNPSTLFQMKLLPCFAKTLLLLVGHTIKLAKTIHPYLILPEEDPSMAQNLVPAKLLAKPLLMMSETMKTALRSKDGKNKWFNNGNYIGVIMSEVLYQAPRKDYFCKAEPSTNTLFACQAKPSKYKTDCPRASAASVGKLYFLV